VLHVCGEMTSAPPPARFPGGIRDSLEVGLDAGRWRSLSESYNKFRHAAEQHVTQADGSMELLWG